MKKWTREDYGFDDSGYLAPHSIEGDEKAAAVCKSSRHIALSPIVLAYLTLPSRRSSGWPLGWLRRCTS